MVPLSGVDVVELRASPRSIWTFVEARTQDGLVGVGEATTHQSQDMLVEAIRKLGRGLVQASDVFGFLDDIRDHDDMIEMSARSALDQALMDIQAQRAGKPLWRILAEERRDTIGVYANINRRTIERSPQGFARSAAEAIRAGFQAVKIAPFDSLTPKMSDVEARPLLSAAFDRIDAVRAEIGSAPKLLVDCHWRLGTTMLDQVLREANVANLYWLECPYPEEESWFADIRDVRRRANALGILTAGAERKSGVGYDPMLNYELYDVLMPDIKHIGGFKAFMTVAHAAAARKMKIAPHNPSGPICHAHSVHVSAAAEAFLILELQFDETRAFAESVVGNLPMPRGGHIVPSDAPGLGLALDRERIVSFAHHE